MVCVVMVLRCLLMSCIGMLLCCVRVVVNLCVFVVDGVLVFCMFMGSLMMNFRGLYLLVSWMMCLIDFLFCGMVLIGMVSMLLGL